jgi:hypothetical protein
MHRTPNSGIFLSSASVAPVIRALYTYTTKEVRMKHTYIVHLGSDLTLATIEADGAFPHLKEGVCLNLTTDVYSPKQGHFLKIQREEIVMSYLGSKIVRNDIHLYCTETELTPEL